MQSAKEYFSNYLADDVIRPLNYDLELQILGSFNPLKSVFEFGCGQGKNLALFKGLGGLSKINGIDISRKAIEFGRRRFALNLSADQRIYVGDENFLSKIKPKSFDVAFTCSVLDHIPEESTVRHILIQLKRISKKGVVLYETLEDSRPGDYYYPHDYESFGFVRDPPDYSYFSDAAMGGDGSVYHIWKWFRRNNKRNHKDGTTLR